MFKVSEVADKLNVSRVTIYNKIKSLKPDIKPYLFKNKGVTFVDITGFDIIKESLEASNDLSRVKNNINSEYTESNSNNEFIYTLNDKINSLQDKYIDSLKEQITHLQKEIDIKNEQLKSKNKLIENFQILIKEDKDKILVFEEKLKQSQANKFFFSKLFKR